MRWATYRLRDGDDAEDRVGVVTDGVVSELEGVRRLLDLLGDDGTRLAEAGERALRAPATQHELDAVELRPPVPAPPSIRDFSAFEEHIRNGLRALGKELGAAWYEIPVFYFSNPNNLVGSGGDVRVPGNSSRVDFELEVAAIIGKPGVDLDPGSAEQHIAGYCIYNDWSARDLQHKETSTVGIGPAKGKDFANSLGPYLVTPDEIEPLRKRRAFDLEMTASVNGRQYSRGSLSDIYWSFGELIAYASRSAELVPGDVIGSGTCGSGCILELSLLHGSEEYPWLAEGDNVVLEVEGLGRLENRVTVGPVPRPLR